MRDATPICSWVLQGMSKIYKYVTYATGKNALELIYLRSSKGCRELKKLLEI